MSAYDRGETIRFHLAALEEVMQLSGVTEICINRPGVVHFEQGPVWCERAMPEITDQWCRGLAIAVGSYTEQNVNEEHPILSAKLPGGERIQIVTPPAAEEMSITVRIPGRSSRTLDMYENEGAFRRAVWAENPAVAERWADIRADDRVLVELLRQRQFGAFLAKAVAFHKNIGIVGNTGAGKTALMNAACLLIDPMERIVTIEDVRELQLPKHSNIAHLLYSKGGRGVAQIGPADLIASTMRMKPDRVLLAELRGSEAFDLLKLLTTGHSGTITSWHAESPALAFERFSLMAREHNQAQAYTDRDLKRLGQLTMDVIVHIAAQPVFNEAGERVRKERYITEVAFDPALQLQLAYGDARLTHATEEEGA
jgi:type IV secretion system protein VirB11